MATINGLDIHYEVEGQGPPIVFIHGLGATSNVWHAQASYICSCGNVSITTMPSLMIQTVCAVEGERHDPGTRSQFRGDSCVTAMWNQIPSGFAHESHVLQRPRDRRSLLSFHELRRRTDKRRIIPRC